MLELDLALEIENFLKNLAAIKQIPAWQIKAERLLTKKLQDLFAATFDKTVSELKKVGVPSNDIQKNMLLAGFAKLENEFKETMGEAAVDSANVSRGKIQSLQYFPITEFSIQYSNLVKDHAFVASERTMARMIGDVMDNLAQSYEEGLGIDEAAENLEGKFKSMMDYELERIARTEIQSHQNEGAHLTCEDLGVTYEQWWTAEDDRVRGTRPEDKADHVVLHGQIVRTGDMFSNGLMYPGDRNGLIEEWINCIPADTLISATEVQRSFSRKYIGDVVTIVTAKGYKLTATPNHPILTGSGWKSIGDINYSDYVISTIGGNNIKTFIKPDINYRNIKIEKINKLFSMLFPKKRISGSTMNFHGDGTVDEQVNIVTNYGSLLNDTDTFFNKHISKFCFFLADILHGFLVGFRSLNFFTERYFSTPDGLVSLFSQPYSFAFRGVGHSNIHGFASVSDFNRFARECPSNDVSTDTIDLRKIFNRFARSIFTNDFIGRQINFKRFGVNDNSIIKKPFPDDFIGDIIIFRDRFNTFPVGVSADNVVNISRTKFDGHVYNLQTKQGFYIANNIITSNCRCRLVPFLMPEGYMAPIGKTYFYEEDLMEVIA